MEERQEARRSRPPQFRIQSGRALTIKNARSRRNLTAREAHGTASGYAALCPAHDNDDALCSRANETCKWGVSDPLRAGPGAKKGAAQRGSLTPICLRQR